MAELGYRWGRFQAWLSLVIGAVLFLVGPWLPWRGLSVVLCLVGLLFLCLFAGLRHKRRYGFVLLYVVAALTLLGVLQSPSGIEQYISLATGIGLWVVPAVFYYPKRYREFGFGKPQYQEIAPTEVVAKPSRPLEDEEVQQVLEHMRKRREGRKAKQEPTP